MRSRPRRGMRQTRLGVRAQIAKDILAKIAAKEFREKSTKRLREAKRMQLELNEPQTEEQKDFSKKTLKGTEASEASQVYSGKRLLDQDLRNMLRDKEDFQAFVDWYYTFVKSKPPRVNKRYKKVMEEEHGKLSEVGREPKKSLVPRKNPLKERPRAPGKKPNPKPKKPEKE